MEEDDCFILSGINDAEIMSCALSNGIFAILALQEENLYVLIYEIGDCSCQTIEPSLCVLALNQLKENSFIASMSLYSERV